MSPFCAVSLLRTIRQDGGQSLRVGGPAERFRRILRCPAGSPRKEVCSWGGETPPHLEGGNAQLPPFALNKKAARKNDRRLSAFLLRDANPVPVAFTGQGYCARS